MQAAVQSEFQRGCRVRALLQSSTGDKTLACTRLAAEGSGEGDGFEMDSADGPDVDSKEKRRFKCLSSAALWGLAPFTEMGITQRWREQGWGGNEFSYLPARGPVASAKPCPSQGGQAVHPLDVSKGEKSFHVLIWTLPSCNFQPSVRSCFSGNTWNASAVF